MATALATATATADTVRSECSELTKRIDTTDDQAEALSEQMLAQIDALGVSIRMSEGRRAPSAAGAEAQDRPAELSSSAEVAELRQAVQLLQQQPRPTPARAARDKELEARLASVESQQQQAATLSGIESERAARLELEQRTGRLEADLSEGLERLSAAGRPNVEASVQQEHAEPPDAGGAAQAEKVDALAEELVLLDTTLAELATQVGTRMELTEMACLSRVRPTFPQAADILPLPMELNRCVLTRWSGWTGGWEWWRDGRWMRRPTSLR